MHSITSQPSLCISHNAVRRSSDTQSWSSPQNWAPFCQFISCTRYDCFGWHLRAGIRYRPFYCHRIWSTAQDKNLKNPAFSASCPVRLTAKFRSMLSIDGMAFPASFMTIDRFRTTQAGLSPYKGVLSSFRHRRWHRVWIVSPYLPLLCWTQIPLSCHSKISVAARAWRHSRFVKLKAGCETRDKPSSLLSLRTWPTHLMRWMSM